MARDTEQMTDRQPIYEVRNIRDSGLSTRCINGLRSVGIEHLGDLRGKKAWELLRIPNFGRLSLKEIEHLL